MSWKKTEQCDRYDQILLFPLIYENRVQSGPKCTVQYLFREVRYVTGEEGQDEINDENDVNEYAIPEEKRVRRVECDFMMDLFHLGCSSDISTVVMWWLW